MTSPTISVVMPVYNAKPFLGEAIESILGQTYKDFEFIIINDGSTDGSKKIIESYAKKDKRIVVINQKNHGLVYSLNKGIAMAKGKYIARMDSDDISYPMRLERQLRIINSRQGVIVVGATYEAIDEEGNKLGITVVSTVDEDIKRELFCRCPFAHGSVLIDKNAIKKVNGYLQRVPVEDYDLWIRLSSEGKFYNTKEILFAYRINKNSISHNNEQRQKRETRSLISKYWKDTQPKIIKCNELAAKYQNLLKNKSIQADLFYDNQIRIMNLAREFNNKELYRQQKCSIIKMRVRNLLTKITK